MSNISENDIVQGDFNEFLDCSILCIIPEIYQGHRKSAYNSIKSLITEESVTINVKYGPKFKSDVYAKFYVCSNSKVALSLDEDDRRWLVVDARDTRLEHSDALKLVEWFNNRQNLQHLVNWFVNDWGQEEWQRHYGEGERAPHTSAKEQLIDDSRPQWSHRMEELFDVMQNHEYLILADFHKALDQDLKGFVPKTSRDISTEFERLGAVFKKNSDGRIARKRFGDRSNVSVVSKTEEARLMLDTQSLNSLTSNLVTFELLRQRVEQALYSSKSKAALEQRLRDADEDDNKPM